MTCPAALLFLKASAWAGVSLMTLMGLLELETAGLVARLPGWQGCLARLLVREVVRPEESILAAEEQEEIGPASPPAHLVREAGKVLADTGSRVRAAVGEVAQTAQWRVAAKVTLRVDSPAQSSL